MEKLQIGVAGLQRGFSFAMLFAGRKDCAVAAVCDLNAERAGKAAIQLGAKAYFDYEEFCRHPLDAIAIVTPPPAHFYCTEKALDAGKHVLCEVPAVVTLEEGKELYEKVKGTGLKYMIAENVCYFPVIQKMQSIVAGGNIGEVVLAEGEYIHDCRKMFYNQDDGLGGGTDTTPSWRCFFNPIQYSTHELGPLLMIIDDTIVTARCVTSSALERSDPRGILTQSALFTTAGGRTIRELVALKIAREPSHHFFALYGTAGSIETDRYRWLDNLKLYSADNIEKNKLLDIPSSLIHDNAPSEALEGGHGTSEYFMVDEFVTAIKQNRRPALNIEQALRMTLPGICAAISADQDGEIVQVPVF